MRTFVNGSGKRLLRRLYAAGAGLAVGAAPMGGPAQGAGLPESRWWSLQPLSQAPAPMTAGLPEGWSSSPIDQFVFAKLTEYGLDPSPRASKHSLIRRATYDLLGLPPAPEEIEAFVKDERPDAYERLIDRLLASPHYGERWGRHWLDVVRFGESRGFERNELIRNLWPFRDYVIRSLNDDKPFDQFLMEHVAGDVIGKGDPEIEVGAAFLVAGPYDDVGNQDAAQARIIRANTVDEIVSAASSAFLGLTIGCARCHDHKFDPITAEDYYRTYAVFAGVHHGERVLARAEERRQREAQVAPIEEKQRQAERALAAFEAELWARVSATPAPARDYSLPKVHPHLTEDLFEPVEARWIRLTILSNNRDPRSAGGARIDEFEVWTAEPSARNVALSSAGARASGPARQPGDFAGAYGPALVIDGEYGARWIVDGPAQLTVGWPKPERIHRIAFSADRQRALPADSGETVFVGEYQIEVSTDGVQWVRVADSWDRPPLNDAFARERLLKSSVTDEDQEARAQLRRELAEASKAVRQVPPLPLVWAGRFEQPGLVRVMKGGDPAREADEVAPSSISALAEVTPGFELAKEAPEGERRAAFGRWLVNRENPLTARVLANRVWQYHFGAGLVETPSDFGRLGGLPSHPELLDWLARRLHELGWRLKPLHREIMLSQTYRQSADYRPEAAELDADARWLWRYPPRRLSAEEIRDTMLSVAGVLRVEMGGPGFQLYRYLQDNVATYVPLDLHGPETFRRAVYHHNARAAQIDLITDFDGPDCAFPAPRRAMTTSPLQALTLFNHRFTLDMAEALARRIERETGSAGVRSRVERAMALVYGRAPSAQEMERSAQFIGTHGTVAFCRALLNSNEMIHIE